jgi:hypothetical protein
MAKIKSINIGGIRGIKDPLPLNLNNRSILIFGVYNPFYSNTESDFIRTAF